jgi:5-methylcytosine-specific restriction protein A
VQRTTGHKLQKWKHQLSRVQPFCMECKVECFKLERDHIVPLWAGGLDVESNTQALCVDCHKRKTAKESRWRYRGSL